MVILDKLLLDGSIEDYEYLNKSRREVDGIDDQEEWNLLKVLSNLHDCVTRTNLYRVRMHWTQSASHLQNSSICSAL